MRSTQITQGQIEKAAAGWFGGCNTNRNPWILDESQYASGVNVVNRGGIVQTRPGYHLLLTLPPGNLQGSAIITITKKDVNGNVFRNGYQFLVFAVEGLVYAIPFPLVQPNRLQDWTAYQLMNLGFNPEAKRIYFCVAQKSLSTVGDSIQLNTTYNVLMMQDGIGPAAFWDGNLDLHVNENRPDLSTPTGTWMAYSGNRLWVARDNALIPGDLLDPLSFRERVSGATQGDFILPETITGMADTVGYNFQSSLIVFTQEQTFSFLSYISDREAWSATTNFQTVLYPALGCVAGLSIVSYSGLLWWYSKGGLVSFNSATTAYLTSRVKYMDNEMVQWTSKMYTDKTGICACSFGSYMGVSIPSEDVFNSNTMVMDYAVADELNSVSPPAWQGVWTGIRPVNWLTSLIKSTGAFACIAASVDYESLNGSHNHIWQAFRDERTDSFDYLDASNATLTAHNPIYSSFETKLLGDGLDLKVFKFLYTNLMEVAGPINFKASFRGTRGAYKQLINQEIISITEPWQTNDAAILARMTAGEVFIPQTRRLVSQIAKSQDTEQDKNVEFPLDQTIDRCFSILFQWCGHAAVESTLLIMEPYTEKPTGTKEEDETTLNVVTRDGNSSAYNEGLTSTTTTVAPVSTSFNFSNNLFNRPFTPRYRDAYYSSIPPIKPAILIEGQCVICLPCARDNFPPVTFDPTNNDEGPGYGPPLYIGNKETSYTANCPIGTGGPPVTITIPPNTYFSLSQLASDIIAYNAAVAQANAALVCITIPVVESDEEGIFNDTPFSYQIVATNSPTSYSAVGLPTGLSVNASTGLISGTITGHSAGEEIIITLQAFNAAGQGNGTLTLNVQSTPSNGMVVNFGGASGFSGTSTWLTVALDGASPIVAAIGVDYTFYSSLVIAGSFTNKPAPNDQTIGQPFFFSTPNGDITVKDGSNCSGTFSAPDDPGQVLNLEVKADGTSIILTSPGFQTTSATPVSDSDTKVGDTLITSGTNFSGEIITTNVTDSQVVVSTNTQITLNIA